MGLTNAVFCLLLAAAAAAQVIPDEVKKAYRYGAFRETTLESAAEAVTLQTASTAARTVFFEELEVYCSAECTVSIEQGGTAASGTAGTPIKRNTSATAVAAVYVGSDAGTGTVIRKFVLGAGAYRTIDLRGMTWSGAGRMTARIASMTGTVRISMTWAEAS